jgi:hypothetical protein
MASGHGYRAHRPNTWLLRPLLQSEVSSCQPGAVHTPISEVAARLIEVRSMGHSGRDLLTLSSSQLTRFGHGHGQTSAHNPAI